MTKDDLPTAVLGLTRRQAVRNARDARAAGEKNVVPVWPSPVLPRFIAMARLGGGPVFSSVEAPIYVGLSEKESAAFEDLVSQCIQLCQPGSRYR